MRHGPSIADAAEPQLAVAETVYFSNPRAASGGVVHQGDRVRGRRPGATERSNPPPPSPGLSGADRPAHHHQDEEEQEQVLLDLSMVGADIVSAPPPPTIT